MSVNAETRRRARALTLGAAIGVLAACASSSGAASPTRLRPPELLTRSRPEIVQVGVTPNAARPYAVVDLQVVVKPDGTADLTTLELSGPGAEANRAVVTAWLQDAQFRPGTEGGIPVAAVFTMPLTAMTRSTRVR
jgi:hypothetical protein